MISIFIMYSGDRAKPLEYTIACLKDMEGYEDCQRTILYDNRIDWVPDGWQPLRVPRIKDQFCWASMWDAGVASAKHEIVWYLDSDRLLPSSYIKHVAQCKDGQFVFSSRHYMMLKEMNLEQCKKFLVSDPMEYLLGDDEAGHVRYEPRFKDMIHVPGKNAMSGNTAFTRSTYYRLGGVDRWYCGHGAFADTDFHTMAHLTNCKFVDTEKTELHYIHEKRHGDHVLSEMELRKLTVNNYVYYCRKWGLPRTMAESLAFESGLESPEKYVAKRWKALDHAPWNRAE